MSEIARQIRGFREGGEYLTEETRQYYHRMAARAMIAMELDPADTEAQKRRREALIKLGMLKDD